jgi:hypothetical protein
MNLHGASMILGLSFLVLMSAHHEGGALERSKRVGLASGRRSFCDFKETESSSR